MILCDGFGARLVIFFFIKLPHVKSIFAKIPLDYKLSVKFFFVWSKKLYTGTPNSDKRKLCTVHCGRNANKPSAPTEVGRKGLQL